MTMEEFFKTQTTKKEKNRRKIFRCILIILCLIIILFSLYTIFKWFTDNYKIRQINKKIDNDININNNDKKGELINPPKNKNSNYYYYSNIPFYEVSFSILSTLNEDTVAYIRLRGTNIKYPIVQTSNNNYYLTHSFDKTTNKAGWIFLDYKNNINDLDDNTVIYGHARLDNTMFGSLKNVLSKDWQSDPDNYVIFISTPIENMIFQIFSIYTIKSEGYYITTNFENKALKQAWIDTMKKRNISKINTEVDINDKILTLSTCQNYQDRRIVVHSKLIKRQKRTY